MSRATDLARLHTDSALQIMAEIMEDPFAENRDRLRAAEAILDRGHGKAAQAIIAVPPSIQLQRKLAALSNDELLQIVKGTPLPQLALPEPEPDPIDAEFTDVPRGTSPPARDPLLD